MELTKFLGSVGLCKGLINSASFGGRSRDVAMAINLRRKIVFVAPNFIVADWRFGSLTPEFHLLIVLVWKNWQKSAYPADYLRTCSTDLGKIFNLIDIWVGMIILTLALRLLKVRCYNNQLFFLRMGSTSLRWCSTKNWIIAICIRVLTRAMMQLHRVKIWWPVQ